MELLNFVKCDLGWSKYTKDPEEIKDLVGEFKDVWQDYIRATRNQITKVCDLLESTDQIYGLAVIPDVKEMLEIPE